MASNLELDIKDKRILKELFVDGRMPISSIAKKVGLSKEVVSYRVNNMIEKGLLLGFNSIYDVQRMGWKIYLVYLKLKSLDNPKEQEIISVLQAHKNVAWLIKCIGNYDLIIKVFAKDDSEYNQTIKEIENLIGLNMDDYDFDIVSREHPVPVTFLYDPIKADHYKDVRKEGVFSLSETDCHILEELAHDSRMQISQMSTRLKIPRESIAYHLKKLEDEKIILKYRPSLWSGSKSLGYSWYLINLKLKLLNKQKQMSITSYIANHPNVSYYYELTGNHDFGFEIRLKTGDELNDVLMNIRSILGEGLKNHELTLILKEHKYTYFPGCMKIN